MSKFNEIIEKEQPVLVDFYADWCGPCQTMAPYIERVAKEVEGKAKVLKVNIDKNNGAAIAYGIRNIPTLIIFQNGEIKWRHSGILSGRQIKEQLEKYM